jgi:hypothetical protein
VSEEEGSRGEGSGSGDGEQWRHRQRWSKGAVARVATSCVCFARLECVSCVRVLAA